MTTPFDDDDPVLNALRVLPAHDVPAGRADEVRRRCEAALGRRARREQSVGAAGARAWRQVLEPATVAGICALYLFEVVRRAFQLQGF